MHSYPREKIIVASSFLMYLDIVSELIRRNKRLTFRVAEYNGTITSSEERAAILGAFNARDSGPRLLLLSAAAGGTGLNVTGASHLIICEPFWSAGQEEQLIGRVHRMSQDRPVKIYKLSAPLSEIDTNISKIADMKASVNQDLMKVIRRKDSEVLDLPPLPTQEDLRRARA
jgi:SNF2 family DNA or RNA helicase